jgi:hypothetical protein
MFYLAFREKKLSRGKVGAVGAGGPDDLIGTSTTGLFSFLSHLVLAMLLVASHKH